MGNKLVSIISPCFNGGQFLSAFLESVLAQDYYPIELLLVDDGSTDNTKDIIDSYAQVFIDRNVVFRYFYQENRGAAAAINCGLKHYSGDYLMWVDSDDILLYNNVSTKVQYLEDHTDCGFVIAQGEIVQSSDTDTSIGIIKRIRPEGEDTLFADLIYERNVVFCPGVIMTKTNALKQAIPTNRIYESFQGQNWQLMLPLAYNFKCGYIDKVLFKCVAHPDSHSRRERSYRETVQRQIDFELLLIETIHRIAQMPQEEKTEWEKRISIKHSTNILRLALNHWDLPLYLRMKKKIRKAGERLQIQDTFWYRIGYPCIRRMRLIVPRRFILVIKRLLK